MASHRIFQKYDERPCVPPQTHFDVDIFTIQVQQFPIFQKRVRKRKKRAKRKKVVHTLLDRLF